MPDDIFADPRWAEIYDSLDGTRDDLDLYEAIVDEFGAQSVIDLGCGTGSLALRLVARGVRVTGIDPAGASLAVAGRKPGAQAVRWILGDASDMAELQADAVVITGNAAQVFLDDAEWNSMLRSVAAVLSPGGIFVFEVRDPARRAWEEWAAGSRVARHDTPQGLVERWTDVLEVDLPLVTFRQSVRFVTSGNVLTSNSTLRFRERAEIERSLTEHGFDVLDVRDAPDRPGLEFVFVAQA